MVCSVTSYTETPPDYTNPPEFQAYCLNNQDPGYEGERRIKYPYVFLT